MYDWMSVEASRQNRERLLQNAERSRAVHALRATRGRRASLLSALWWELTRDLGRARMFLHALRASD